MNSPIPSIPSLNAARLLRRDMLRIGGFGMLGLGMPHLLQAAAVGKGPQPRAKSVIFLYQFGGPSHLDTFDLKPDAPEGIRSRYGYFPSSLPGHLICEHLPNTAQVMHKVTLLHTVNHTMKNHNSASYYALTGAAPPVDDIRLKDTIDLFPAYGSVVDRLSPANPGIPTFASLPTRIADGSVTPGQHASFLGKAHDPLLLSEDEETKNFQLPALRLPSELSLSRLNSRREIQKLIDRQTRSLDSSTAARGMDKYYDKALSMFSSPNLHTAFDLSREKDAVREAYGRTTYGQSCLLARRLVESGVKFVNVYFAPNIGGRSKDSGGWDTHGFDGSRMYPILKGHHLPLTDHTLPVLLNDLDERGLLEETLVVWMGEFGRTPLINKNSSRDHWPHCYTVLLAGGGVKRGFRYGASDAEGAYPASNPVRLDDLAATMYHLLGIDPHTFVKDRLGRPVPISAGTVIHGIIA
ncbi:MAG: DUF1501 domain-containing protein [Planctomycetales bacterium]